MQKRILALLLSSGILLGLTASAVPVNAAESFALGNSAQALLAGGEVATVGDRIYTSTGQGIGFYEGTEATALTDESADSLNVFDDALWYVSGHSIKRMNLADGSIETMLEWPSKIEELVVVNGIDAYFLAGGSVYLLGEDGEAVQVMGDGEIKGFVPTEYGILTQKGDLFDWTVYANGQFVASGVYSWTVKGEDLIISKDGAEYAQSLMDVFSDGETSVNFTVYDGGSENLDDILGGVDCDECNAAGDTSQHAAHVAFDRLDAAEDDEAVAVSAYASVSDGQKNMVKRAKQQLNIAWTPKADIIGWGRKETDHIYIFKKGTTYHGLPYGQAVNARYIPYKEDNYTISTSALQLFVDKVNDIDSKMYTSYSDYNRRAPYYSSDCSAFVSYCWNITRTTTHVIENRCNYVSDQSIYGMQIGDILNKAGSHVVIVTDVGYTSSGKLSYIDISEQTPPQVKTTRYGTGGDVSLSDLTSKYFKSYTLYRFPDASKVTFTSSSAVSVGSVTVAPNIDRVSSGNDTVGNSDDEELGNRRSFVIRLYKYVLDRTPSDSEVDNWMKQLQKGKCTGAEMAANFFFGQEGKKVISDNYDFVSRLYRAMFGRKAKDSEITTWTEQNKLRWQYFHGFVDSKEFRNNCAECGIEAGTFDGTYLMSMYSGVKQFVERLYTVCLGRDTDKSGLISWTCAICGGDIGGSSAAYGFFFSREFLNKQVGNGTYVDKLYNTFFDRDPDSKGRSAWMKALSDGNSRLDVLMGFAGSREYANLCAKYGITV